MPDMADAPTVKTRDYLDPLSMLFPSTRFYPPTIEQNELPNPYPPNSRIFKVLAEEGSLRNFLFGMSWMMEQVLWVPLSISVPDLKAELAARKDGFYFMKISGAEL